MFAKTPQDAVTVQTNIMCTQTYLMMDKMLVVKWHALHIPGDSAIALELAACPLPLASWPNQPPLFEQAQILKV